MWREAEGHENDWPLRLSGEMAWHSCPGLFIWMRGGMDRCSAASCCGIRLEVDAGTLLSGGLPVAKFEGNQQPESDKKGGEVVDDSINQQCPNQLV